jgi:hypothetical protein
VAFPVRRVASVCTSSGSSVEDGVLFSETLFSETREHPTAQRPAATTGRASDEAHVLLHRAHQPSRQCWLRRLSRPPWLLQLEQSSLKRCALRPNHKLVRNFSIYLVILRENSLVPSRIRLQLYQEQCAGSEFAGRLERNPSEAALARHRQAPACGEHAYRWF